MYKIRENFMINLIYIKIMKKFWIFESPSIKVYFSK